MKYTETARATINIKTRIGLLLASSSSVIDILIFQEQKINMVEEHHRIVIYAVLVAAVLALILILSLSAIAPESLTGMAFLGGEEEAEVCGPVFCNPYCPMCPQTCP